MDFVNGDAAAPEADGNKTIARVPNDIGAWGAGIDRAISRRRPEREFRCWYRDRATSGFRLANPPCGWRT